MIQGISYGKLILMKLAFQSTLTLSSPEKFFINTEVYRQIWNRKPYKLISCLEMGRKKCTVNSLESLD